MFQIKRAPRYEPRIGVLWVGKAGEVLNIGYEVIALNTKNRLGHEPRIRDVDIQ